MPTSPRVPFISDNSGSQRHNASLIQSLFHLPFNVINLQYSCFRPNNTKYEDMFHDDYLPPNLRGLPVDDAANILTYCQGDDDNAVCAGDAISLFKAPGSPASFSSTAARHRRRQSTEIGKKVKRRQLTNKFHREFKYVQLLNHFALRVFWWTYLFS